MVKDYRAVVAENRKETPSVNVISFRLDEPMNFKAGQWLYIWAQKDGKDFKKPYSIASPPSLMKTNMLELCIKRVESGFMSNLLCDAQPGQEFRLTGPLGVFLMKENDNDKIFIATGSGVAPFHSMIPTLLENGFQKDVWLFFGVRKQEDLIYRQYFENIEKLKKNFHFVSILSREDWKDKGHVQDVLPAYLKAPEGKDVYICGLTPMIDAVRATLSSIGFAPTQLHFEKYI